MNTYQSPPFPIPYGNAPREGNPQWPAVNIYGQPLVQPQPNPYFAHWPQQMGQASGTGGGTLKWLLVAGAAVGIGWYVFFRQKQDGDWEVRLWKKNAKTPSFNYFDTEAEALSYRKRMMDTGNYRKSELATLGSG